MERYRMAVIGSLFPNRLHAYLKGLDSCKFPYAENLFVNKELVEVIWCARGGLTLDRLHRELWPHIMSCGRLDAAIVQIGSNDMCHISVDEFVCRFTAETLPSLKALGCGHVTITQAFHRRPGFYTANLDLGVFNGKINDLNATVQSLRCPPGMSIVYWAHANVLNCETLGKIWSPDGVHFNRKGNAAYARSMCGGLKNAINNISG